MTAHLLGGVIALIAALVALLAEKGGGLHRGSGRVFVAAMVVMAVTGAALAAFVPERLLVVTGGLTLYLVVTALLTVRPPPENDRSIHQVALAVGAAVALLGLTFGAEAWASEQRELDGYPAGLYWLLGAIAAVAALADLHRLRSHPLTGGQRIGRHVWRMGMALALATAAFFLGQAQVFPEALRHGALLSLPVIAVLAVTGYWFLRVRYFEARRNPDSGP